jgi:hypothetical protein
MVVQKTDQPKFGNPCKLCKNKFHNWDLSSMFIGM